MTKNTHKLPKKLWAGFIDDRVDFDPYKGPSKMYGVLYTSKRAAKECYEDVRRVEVREVK